MKGGKKRFLFNYDQIDPDDGDFFYVADVRTIGDAEFNAIPAGMPMVYDGLLLKGAASPAAYVIERNKKRRIPDPGTFTKDGYQWGAIAQLPQAWMDMIPTGHQKPDVSWSDACLCHAQGAGPAFYVMHGGFRRWICSFDIRKLRNPSIPAPDS